MVFAEISHEVGDMGINVSIACRIQSPARQHTGSSKIQQKYPTRNLGANTKTNAFKEPVIEQSFDPFGIH